MSAQAPLIEIFSAFQGEGPMVGRPTLFVRTAGCPLRCRWCDTVESHEVPGLFARKDALGRVLGRERNPATPERILELLDGDLAPRPEWVSLTGGEPLLHPAFAAALFGGVRARGLQTHLETAALDAGVLRGLLPLVDHLSMDWKLPAAVGGKDLAEGHLDCLEAAVSRSTDVAVKVVLCGTEGEPPEFEAALDRLEPFRASFRLVLQLVTPCGQVREGPSPDYLLAQSAEALERGFSVLVLPQVHRMLGLS